MSVNVFKRCVKCTEGCCYSILGRDVCLISTSDTLDQEFVRRFVSNTWLWLDLSFQALPLSLLRLFLFLQPSAREAEKAPFP